MKSLYITILFSLALLAAGCTSDDVSKAPPRADSTNLQKTNISAHMEAKIEPGKNLLYCSTFQVAWNELKDDIIKEDIRLVDEPPMVGFLNKSLSTRADISDDCYVAMAGFGKDGILEKINKALKEKFGDNAPVVQEQLRPEEILAYSYLYKNLRFKRNFEKLKEPVTFRSNGGETEVKAFGVKKFFHNNEKHHEIAKQVEVLYYDYEEDGCYYVIRLKPTSPKDEIVLAKVKPEKTLLGAIEAVQVRIEKGTTTSLRQNDVLKVPKLDLNIKHSYRELIGKLLENKGFVGYWIRKARQDIRFNLSEKGALLASEARVIITCTPRHMVFDRPFLIYLKEKDARYPYFAMWVDNPELMVKE